MPVHLHTDPPNLLVKVDSTQVKGPGILRNVGPTAARYVRRLETVVAAAACPYGGIAIVFLPELNHVAKSSLVDGDVLPLQPAKEADRAFKFGKIQQSVSIAARSLGRHCVGTSLHRASYPNRMSSL